MFRNRKAWDLLPPCHRPEWGWPGSAGPHCLTYSSPALWTIKLIFCCPSTSLFLGFAFIRGLLGTYLENVRSKIWNLRAPLHFSKYFTITIYLPPNFCIIITHIGLAKSSFGFFWATVCKNPNELFGQPNSICVCTCVSHLCTTLCNPMDCSPPGSSVHGILQVRTLEWVAIPFSRGTSWPSNGTSISWLQADSLPSELPGKRYNISMYLHIDISINISIHVC